MPSKKISQLDPLALPTTAGELPIVQGAATHRVTVDALAKEAIFAGRWDDLRFPATGINPPGAPSDPSRDNQTGLLDFSANSENVITALAQMPHKWLEGSAIRPHLHFVKPNTGDVVWNLQMRRTQARGEAWPGVWTDLGDITALAAGDTSATTGVVIAEWPEIDMTGYRVSSLLLFRLSRKGADAADTMPGNATLIEFDLHYQIDAIGSIGEFTKDTEDP